jgi:hypothetical protein
MFVVGCKTCDDCLVMERTVPVSEYSKTVDEMAKQIEMQNRYEAMDVQETIYGDKVTIRVIAEKMSVSRSYQRSVVKLQRENCQLKKRVAELEKQIKDSKLVPVTVSTNGNVSVDLRNVRSKVISVY